MSLILIILILVLLLGGGGYYMGPSTGYPVYGGSALGLIVVILLILWVLGVLPRR